jgi:hypothetical protein
MVPQAPAATAARSAVATASYWPLLPDCYYPLDRREASINYRSARRASVVEVADCQSEVKERRRAVNALRSRRTLNGLRSSMP